MSVTSASVTGSMNYISEATPSSLRANHSDLNPTPYVDRMLDGGLSKFITLFIFIVILYELCAKCVCML